MDSSKIMVLEKGELAEFDKPKNLLVKPTGIFTGMVDATGPVSSAYLKKIANGEIDVMSILKDSMDQSIDRPANTPVVKQKESPKMEVEPVNNVNKQKKDKKSKKEKKNKKDNQ